MNSTLHRTTPLRARHRLADAPRGVQRPIFQHPALLARIRALPKPAVYSKLQRQRMYEAGQIPNPQIRYPNIWVAQQGLCLYCLRPMHYGAKHPDLGASVDHIVARANGGTDEGRNLAYCHYSENSSKGKGLLKGVRAPSGGDTGK